MCHKAYDICSTCTQTKEVLMNTLHSSSRLLIYEDGPRIPLTVWGTDTDDPVTNN